MTNLQFVEWPWALALALLLPVVVALLIARGRKRRAARLSRLGTTDMIARLAPNVIRTSRGQIGRAIAYSALFGIAFAGPRWGVTSNVVAQKGVDIVLALDASQSMLATDERPSRLAAMKEAVYRLRELSPSDRFALVVFAGRSYILTPMTVDDAALNLFLDNLDPTTVGQGGSSLSSAIRQSTNLLAIGQSESGKAIVLMSDGEGFEDDQAVVNEAKRAAGMGIRLITVGFGTTAGSQIPIRENGVVTVKKDESGATVVTRYSPTMLQEAARAGGGSFIPAGDPDRASHIRQALTGLRAGAGAGGRGGDLAPRFQWFLLPAILLLILDTIRSSMRARKRPEAKYDIMRARSGQGLVSVVRSRNCPGKS
jgi:Ca-activated chloride channel homolog